jgi:uncharacterized protein with PQ loop repeat
MNIHSVQALAGFTSSMIFISSNLPSLFKAFKTKDMRSYSLGQLILGNVGNWVYWLYVRSLPVGPVWYLQAFFTTASGLMLFSYLRYEKKWFRAKRRNPQPLANSAFANHPCGNSRNQLDE